MKVVTYATHSEGTFEDIVGNQYGVKVDVLGFGTKWKGFMDKIQGVYNYCKALPEDEIVVFLDGFDSEILKPLTGLEKTFRDLNCGVLLSKHRTYEALYKPTKQVFGTCKNVIANSGLYMGTVSHLKMFLKLVLDEETSDDQTNFNTVCSQFDWVKVDDINQIFYNVIPGESKINNIPNVYFKSYPGNLSIKRYIRAIKEYYPFFIREISLVLLIATLILFMWRM
jgi:hypothetical protein